MPTIHSGYIRTPAELDAAARALERSLGQTSSPIKRFLLITEFASHTRALPASWLAGYLPMVAPLFVELLRLPYLRNVPPHVWVDAYDFLLLIRTLDWHTRVPGYDEAREKTLQHTILAHAFVSSLRELHAFFLRQGIVVRKLREREWMQVFGASNTSFGLFEKYTELLQRNGEEVTDIIAAASIAWVHFRSRPDAVSVILLDDEAQSRYAAGRVLLMDILPHKAEGGESHLSNLLGDSGHEVIRQLHRAEQFARDILHVRFSATPPDVRHNYSVHESSAELVGGSLGLPALAGVLANRTQQMNLREEWTLPSTVGCTGRIEEDGSVDAGSWETMEAKLRLAFFSPLERVVIPAAHREAALHAVQMLQREYPNRILDIVGVAHVRELPDTPGVYQMRQRGGAERLRHVLFRANAALVLFLLLVVLAGAGYILYSTYYDYPNLEHARGIAVEHSAIVFNPKDSLRWCFRDGAAVRDPHLPFGDLETGDGFTRTLSLWNMTPSTLEVQLTIDGPDSADWYVNSGDHSLRVASAGDVTFSLMFAPRHAGPDKRARLVLRDAADGKELYALTLSGAAGSPRPGGYALHLDGIDDYLYFGRRSTAFDLATSPGRELTFECWFRPMRENRNFMLLHNGIDKSGERPIQDLYLGFDSLHTCYYRVGSEVGIVRLPPHLKPTAGSWNHIALAISLPERHIALYLNGQRIDDRTVDFLMDGFGVPYVTIGAFNNTQNLDLFFEGDLDEVRLWQTFRSLEEIRDGAHRHVDGLSEHLAGYWDMDAAVETIVFNASKRAHSGTLLNRPTLVRSDIPFNEAIRDYRLVTSPEHGMAVELDAGRYLACVRPLLPRYGPATIALRFRQTDEPAIHFYYVRTERGWISLEESYSYTRVARNHVSIAQGWRHGACTVSRDGELVLFIDGVPVDTNRTTENPPYDWHRNFEGMLLGFRFDKENQLHSSFYNWYYPTLTHPRSYADFLVWDRMLTPQEIHALAQDGGALPEKGLRARWRLDQPADNNRNFIDEVGGELLHLKRVRAWE